MAEKNIRSLIKLCLPVIGIIPWVVIRLKLIFTAGKSGVSVQQAATCSHILMMPLLSFIL